MEKTFIVDDYVMVNNKKFMLNLNVYRNTNPYTLNQAKINFKNNLYMSYPELHTFHAERVKISYEIIPNDRRMFDTLNCISVVDKFFCDALVQSGVIVDDNYTHVSYGEIKVSEIEKSDCKKIKIICKFS